MHSLHLRRGKLCSTSLRAEYLHQLCGLLYRIFVCSSPFINLFNHLLMSVWTHGYLFYTLGYNSVLLHLSVSPALAIGSSFSWFLCLSLLHTPMMVSCLVLFLSTSLLSGIIRCSRLILYTSCPSPKISHFSKESWFLFLENSIRNQDMGAKCAQYYWGVVASSLSADRTRKDMCVY